MKVVFAFIRIVRPSSQFIIVAIVVGNMSDIQIILVLLQSDLKVEEHCKGGDTWLRSQALELGKQPVKVQ